MTAPYVPKFRLVLNNYNILKNQRLFEIKQPLFGVEIFSKIKKSVLIGLIPIRTLLMVGVTGLEPAAP